MPSSSSSERIVQLSRCGPDGGLAGTTEASKSACAKLNFVRCLLFGRLCTITELLARSWRRSEALGLAGSDDFALTGIR